MAFSTPVDADELAQLALGKPFLLGENILRAPLAAPEWRFSGSWASGTDITQAGMATPRLYDEHAGIYTRPQFPPDVVAYDEIYLIFDLDTVALERGFDTIIVDWDLRDMGDDVRVLVQVDTASDFSTAVNVTTDALIVGLTPLSNFGNYKWVVPNLLLNHGYFGFRYMRFRFQRKGGTQNFDGPPYVGEIYAGIRRQLSIFPQIPHDDQRRESSVADFIAYSGRRHRVVRAKGSQPFPVAFNFGNEAGIANVSDLGALRAWYEDIDQGVKPFYYCDQPIASPARALFLDLPDPALDIPRTSFGLRQFSMNAREMPPYRTLEIVE